MPAALIVWFTSLFLGLQPITTDLYLPALPSMTAALGASMPQAQLTLSALLLSFGISQLIWGPVSDKYGRKPVLIIGLVLYVLASVGSALVANVEALILWRSCQGAAMGAVVMCARAMGRDLYAPEEAARLMSKGLSGLGVIAVLSVPIGSLINTYFGWRFALLALAVYGAATLALTLLKFEETNQRRNSAALQPAILISTWRGILAHPQFWTYALLALTSYCGLFIFLATSSFVYLQVLAAGQWVYSAVMVGMSAFYVLGTFLSRRVLARHGVQHMLWIGGWITLLACLMYSTVLFIAPGSVIALAVCQFVFMIGHGFHQPAGQSGSAAAFPQAAGAASAMAGFLMMLSAFATGFVLGQTMDGTVRPMVWGIVFWGLLIVAVAWVLVQRYGKLSKT
ncbi:Bcr/CflA family efflux MFS transporter [Variovorax sp. PCZ-1]|uniref:Bcr/CflA family efflux MFS transporter n=1 Tax=Variovorax sp. PCZ-1 TaxID=2835533 RepID=UPI001BCEF2DB|nr:Bcr/CflA family efflux MFS transporter [Variovorax sp. PCZ-1]MBS7808168.1 Bcr/CflA family efflux MFS transporter [Variovorax sp. PCZ-1]